MTQHKHIIIVSHAEKSADVNLVMLKDIDQALRAKNKKSHLFLLKGNQSIADLQDTISALDPDPNQFIIFNMNSKMRTHYHKNGPVAMNFAFLVDHPAHHLEHLDPKINHHFFQQQTCSVVDRDHLKSLSHISLQMDHFFMPHGGPGLFPDPIALKERPIDLLFAGVMTPQLLLEELQKSLQNFPKDMQQLILHAIQKIKQENITTDEAIADAFDARRDLTILSQLSFEAYSKCVDLIEAHIKAFKRMHLLIALIQQKHFNVHIVGPNTRIFCEEFLKGHIGDHVHFHGTKKFADILDMMKQTKIVVNAPFQFRNGSHERIWYALACGCAVLSSQSHYLSEIFDPTYEISLFEDVGERSFQIDWDRFSNLARLQEGTEQAIQTYLKNHTWAARMDDFCQFVRI